MFLVFTFRKYNIILLRTVSLNKRLVFLIIFLSVIFMVSPVENQFDAVTGASKIIPYEASSESVNTPEIKTPDAGNSALQKKTDPKTDIISSASEILIPDLEKTEIMKPSKMETKKAQVGDDSLAVVMKVDKKTNEIILKKPPTDAERLQKLNEEAVELKDEDSTGKLKNENPKRDSKVIIFEDSNENIPPSLSYEFDEEKVPETRYYELDNFIPRSVKEFYMSKPKMSFDNNGIVRRSKINIYSSVGEMVFRDAYIMFQKNELKNSKENFTKLIFYNYRVAESSYYIALCDYLVKDYMGALNCLNYTIDNAQKDGLTDNRVSGIYYQMAAIYYEIDEYKTGLSYYQLSLSKDPKNTANYNGAGLCYFKLGVIQKTLEYWLKGSDLGNKDCEANYKWLIKKLAK
jgi:tetratricopeptide (TPR) repeat protein